MIIAIDGPAASGKGTIGRLLAERFNLVHMDTGLLYRGLAYLAMQKGIQLTDALTLAELAKNLDYKALQKQPLRSEEVSQASSQIASLPEVRTALVDAQRRIAKELSEGLTGVVLDGRDIGTKIFPETPYKLYILADIETRARRRHKQLEEEGNFAEKSEVLNDLTIRDKNDTERKASPLKIAPDAFQVDTTHISILEALEKCEEYVLKVLEKKN